MKYLRFTLYVLIMATVLSCKNDNPTDTNEDDNNSIIGQWNWVKTSGGIAGDYELTPETAGYHLSMIFNTNGKLINKKDGVATDTLNFTLKKDLSNIVGDSVNILNVERNSSMPENWRAIVSFKSDTLFLDDDFVDGQRHVYVRIK